jgi:hypothetical protein
VIRNVVMGKVREGADLDALQQALDGVAALDLPGCLAMTVGRDAGLRDGGWDFAIVNDWADAASYRGYDVDAVHNQHRAVIGPQCEQLARVQFEI